MPKINNSLLNSIGYFLIGKVLKLTDHPIRLGNIDDPVEAKEAVNLQTLQSTAVPAGNNAEVQFNSSGSFGSSSKLTFDATTGLDIEAPLTVVDDGGITIGDGNDADQDLITVNVTGSPKISWDESTDTFAFTKGIDETFSYEIADAEPEYYFNDINISLTSNGTATGSDYHGFRSKVTMTGDDNLTSSVSSGQAGISGYFNLSGDATVDEAAGVLGINAVVNTSVGTMTNAFGVAGAVVELSAGATITNGAALYGQILKAGAGTITNAFGLLISDITQGDSANYAIKTGVGQVEFGDDVTMNAGMNAPNIPAYDDDTAAGVGGLSAGDFYQTTGSGTAPLNVAGILMVKQ